MGEGRALGWPGLLWAGQPKGCLCRTTIPSLPLTFQLTFFFLKWHIPREMSS